MDLSQDRLILELEYMSIVNTEFIFLLSPKLK
jgi:hypothetical protein